MLYTAHTDKFQRAKFATIRAARKWAESLGNTANICIIDAPDKRGNPQCRAIHSRDPNGDGMRWYRAEVQS